MSTLRITNIEAKADPSSPTVDEKIKLTNSNGDILVHIDGKTSGITTIGINTTAGNIKFDQNSNVVVTGIITATKFVGTIEPTSLEIGSNIKLGNAGVITATSYVGDGSALTGITGTTINNNADNRLITGSGTANTLEGEATLTYDGASVFELQPASAIPAVFVGDSNRTGAEQGIAHFKGNWNGTTVARMTIDSGSDTSNKDDGIIRFDTAPAGTLIERLRITSNGMVRVNDSASLSFGNNDDMRIFHDGGSANYIDVYNKDLYIRCNRDSGITGGDIVLQPKSGENSAIFRDNGAVELYYDNTKKFETQTSGVVIHEDTDKTIRFTGGIGEIGNVTGFQATNTAGSAIVDLGMRGTTLRFATGSAERLRIDSSGNADFKHKVTIGASHTGGEILALGKTSGTSYLGFLNGGTHVGFVGYADQLIVGGASNEFAVRSQGNLLFAAGGNSERLRIASDGDLTLTGADNVEIKMKCGTSSGNNILAFLNSGGTTRGNITYDSDHNFLLFNVNQAERVRIDSNGYVTLKCNSSNIARLSFNHVNSTRIEYSDQSGNLTFYTNSAARCLVGYGGGFRPQIDNSQDLGLSSQRWKRVYAANGTIQTSDEREKTSIATSTLGTDFIKQLRPVSYKWNVGENIVTKAEDGETDVITPRPGERTHWGFIAQEVKQAADNAGVDFGGWTLGDKDDPDSTQGLCYDQFIAPLTKALQEVIAKNEALEARIAALEGS